GVDKLYGDDGNDGMQGSRGSTNYMYGGAGNDLMIGGYVGVVDNVNYMFGGDGNDAMYGPGRVNFMDGGKGMDYLEVAYFSHDNTLFGGNDNELDVLNDQGDFHGIMITRPGDMLIHKDNFANWPTVCYGVCLRRVLAGADP